MEKEVHSRFQALLHFTNVNRYDKNISRLRLRFLRGKQKPVPDGCTISQGLQYLQKHRSSPTKTTRISTMCVGIYKYNE